MNIRLVILGLFIVLGVNAQVTNEKSPVSWGKSSLKKSTPVSMKSFDLNKLRVEDAKNDLDKSGPWRFGYELKVNLGLNNSGTWDRLSNGDRVWRINIVSKGALTMNFVFDTFKIPEGAKMFLYNNDRTDILGAYTHTFNRPDKMLGTWMIEGENVWIEYYEPASAKFKGELHLSKVVHGYRSVTDAQIQSKALGDSGNCNQDVDCPVSGASDNFDDLKDRLKRSVALFILGGGTCTGTLINNTDNDRKPYFLSANHCFEDINGIGSSPSTWAFRFNWVSPNPSCATTDPSTNGAFDQTTSGATILARNSRSDFMLVNIDSELPDEWDLEWAGWDRTGDAPSFTVGIHHPSGDIMKVARDDNPAVKEEQAPVGGLVAPVDSWQVGDWDLGVTERGSSGSALFDQNGRIIGQLAGGGAACGGRDAAGNFVTTIDNGLPDLYGRFGVSWCSESTGNTNSLVSWLDPNDTKRTKLNMLSQELNGETSTEQNDIICGSAEGPPVVEPEPDPLTRELVIFFNPSRGDITISNAVVEDVRADLKYYVYNISGMLVDSGSSSQDEEVIDMSSKSSGMYFVRVENNTDGSKFTRKVIINNRK